MLVSYPLPGIAVIERISHSQTLVRAAAGSAAAKRSRGVPDALVIAGPGSASRDNSRTAV